MNKAERLPRGVLKVTPECFVVQELVRSEKDPIPLESTTKIQGPHPGGQVTLFNLTKRGVTTEDALWEVARQLFVPRSSVSHHGLKDKHAYTAQRIGIRGGFGLDFFHPDITIVQCGTTYEPLRRGGNLGNRFDIVVISRSENVTTSNIEVVRNYFGDQRFGSENCHLVGKLLLEGRFSEALQLEVKTRMPPRDSSQKKTPKETLFGPVYFAEMQFRVLQWQSHLWNTLVGSLDELPERVPMWSPENARVYRSIWDPRHVDLDAERLLHRFSRKTVFRPQNIVIERQHACWRFRFDLPSGSYATVALSNVFDLEDWSRKRK